ncbi:uncharacterized protein FTOL_05506 [Fusarium torulosum]|uniref:Uncharacterized protein n=1 Tax=Fusarium torulosum TaxID=33205 RepID=A0AAE8M7X2_9HYPO|nr:uncharacterized protein FTOL_05506 [Fusarium torulosum]
MEILLENYHIDSSEKLLICPKTPLCSFDYAAALATRLIELSIRIIATGVDASQIARAKLSPTGYV